MPTATLDDNFAEGIATGTLISILLEGAKTGVSSKDVEYQAKLLVMRSSQVIRLLKTVEKWRKLGQEMEEL